MDFLELAKKRYSAREYSPKEVEQEKLEYILECARLAPSAVNHQPWRFIVVKSDEARKAVQQCYPREWFAQAPLYIVAYAKTSEAWVRGCDAKNHADIDTAIAVEHICLAATKLGLGSCWVCNFDVSQLKDSLHLCSDEYPVAIIPIGYVDKFSANPKSRKNMGEIVTTK